MGDSGATTDSTLNCARDGMPTRLRCAECEAPICPACYVRTVVGLRCPDCAVASGPPVRDAGARPGWLIPAALAAVLAVAVVGAAWAGTRTGGEPVVDVDWPQAPVPETERVRIGTGDLPQGRWTLEARRGPGVCETLTIPDRPARERCHNFPANQHLAFTSTSRLSSPSETVYLTLGLVSDRTERVLVAPEGLTPWEVPALGAGANLGARFFVVHTTSSTVTFTALAADGSELSRQTVAPPPGAFGS